MKAKFLEFLKLSWLKVILTLVIFFVFAPVVYYDSGIRCVTTPCPSEALGSVLDFLFFANSSDYSVSYTLFILELVFSYIMVSIFMFIFSKKGNVSNSKKRKK